MLTRRQFLKLGTAGVAGLAVPWSWAPPPGVLASVQVPAQTPLLGKNIPRFKDPLPTFVGARVSGSSITVGMHEVQRQVLPAGFPPTWVWAYSVGSNDPNYPGVTIEAKRGTPIEVTYTNSLPGAGSMVQKYLTVDQSLHWANPDGVDMMVGNDAVYNQNPPAVVHLHGGEVPSDFDGGPDQWFTPDGKKGLGYRTLAAATNGAKYRYPNAQEATTLWFHDHTLGATRLNVYAGLAAFYLLRDGYDTGVQGTGLNLPAGAQEIEIAIQDRQFDTDGQLFFPDGYPLAGGLNGPPPNPLIHPYWNPEFFGDVMVVNGKSWPYLSVEPRRYRFRLLDGCNARFLELRLENRATNKNGPPIWVIGTDGGLLNAPVKLNDPNASKAPRLLMAPGERYDVIIDFKGYEGQTLTLINSAKAPYPNGMTADPKTTGQVMEFRVGAGPVSDTSFDPSAPGATLRGGSGRPATITPLTLPSTNQVRRRLTLNEVMGLGGPVEVLVNNTKWNGRRDNAAGMPIPGSTVDSQGNYVTELPKVGSTELWEIVNLTGDAHPIHLHLVQFQLVSRQSFNVTQYSKTYNALFPNGTFGGVDMATGAWVQMSYPGGVFIPAYGPPLSYAVNSGSAGYLGGNPDIARFLQGPPAPPKPEEAGWKDTVQANPGEVTTILVRFAQQDGTSFPFDPTGATSYANGPDGNPAGGPGYVWHCHIVDHEDNEMMRPYHPVS